ncbi:27891_t:CDS:2 [Gigaspora margarita]|uniref:27891_t:CDS:1 n=1 Tax=Gigaspora margarita TaxID=4874 RepID=A0ABN7UVH7_GIGMA|nr:27891_t:CDS:2 [Gigaspora margarita]
MSVSFVLAGIFLPNDFNLSTATTFEHTWCGICGFLLSLSSISNHGVALALSTELYISLALAPIAKQNDGKIRRLNIFLTGVIPILCIALSLLTLALHDNSIFEVIDTGGICQVSRQGDYRAILFFVRTVPEYLPLYPSCVLSESFQLPWQSRISPKPSVIRSTRAGPPPNTASSSPKPIIPRNVLIRMASWCCLLLISGIPMATLILIENIHYVIHNNHFKIIDNPFWDRNGITLHMCFSMILFLICFGTGEFATEQYGILWTKILGFICCSSPKNQLSHQIEIEVVDPSSLNSDMNPESSSSIPISFISSPQVTYIRSAPTEYNYVHSTPIEYTYVRSTPIEYTYVTPPIDKKYLTGARAGWVTSKNDLCQKCQTPIIKSDSGNKSTDETTQNQSDIIRQTALLSSTSQCTEQGNEISHTGSSYGQVLITIPEEAKFDP